MVIPANVMKKGEAWIVVACTSCGKEQPTIEASVHQLVAWRNGAHIQAAFPQLTSDQRELLISGTCGECWDKMFGEEAEER